MEISTKISLDFDENTIGFYENIDDEGYFYELYVLIDDKKAAIIITDDGISIDFVDGSCIHTNIVPNRLFPNMKSLPWKCLRKIIKILEDTGMEGKHYSAKEEEELYQKWVDLGKPS